MKLIDDNVLPSDLRRFASVMIIQAFTDLRDRDPLKQIDALLWLTDEYEFEFWSDAADFNPDPYKLFISGELGRVKRKGRAKHE